MFFKVLKLPTNFTSRNFRRPSGGDFPKLTNFKMENDHINPPQAKNFADFGSVLQFFAVLRSISTQKIFGSKMFLNTLITFSRM